MSLLNTFIDSMGNSVEKFRYYNKRNISCALGHEICYIFCVEDIPVAYGHLDREGDDVWLGVCVSQDHTGQGYGTRMMKNLTNYAKSNIIKKIRLSVDKDNEPAFNMYSKFGFVVTEKKNGIIFMTLEIGDKNG